jgi:hypothetical protein
MRVHLGHGGYTGISTTQAGSLELWVACLDKDKDEGVSFYLTPERAERLHGELSEWLKVFGPKKDRTAERSK